jgi:uncharacterized protein (DUF362 family)
LQQTEDRERFVRKAFRQFDITHKVRGKGVLLKPNIVSYEPYPTTTHPVVVETCLELLQESASGVIVADGPAFDASDHRHIIEEHPLKESCEKFGIELMDLLSGGTQRVKTGTMELEVSAMASQYDFIVSLPVLKSHSICGLTGALKNQLGFLSVAEKSRLHAGNDVHRIIAELNQVIVPDLFIVDAVQTMITTNEARHGGKPASLGYMIAGTDPLSLDVSGFELLAQAEPKLKNRSFSDIRHLKHMSELNGWDGRYDVVEW